jgi:nucleoside-diphosphate-sugar epimerase
VALALAEAGHDVRALVRAPIEPRPPGVASVPPGDLRDGAALREALAGVRTVCISRAARAS